LDAKDHELVLSARAGERQAFIGLVDRYRGRVFALATAIMGDRESALQLTKETFVRAHRELPRLRDPERFPGWLSQIAYRAGRDARHQRMEDSESELAQDASPKRPLATIAVGFAPGEPERALVEALVAALPERVRVVLDLRFRENLGYQEIAETLELKPEDVRKYLVRGLRHLRAKLPANLKRPAPGKAP
jgi:RNA polymerase sigma-70 factor (ECF subfamily)